MAEYLFCISRPDRDGVVEIMTSRDDPRLESAASIMLRRSLGIHAIEWTLPVVSGDLSMAALKKSLRGHRLRGKSLGFRCDPMTARGEAIKLTTLRPGKAKDQKRSLFKRLIRAA
jgi:hypothetical protein